MKYFGGCDVGSTYTKTVILDENGAIVAANTIKSKINSAQSAKAGLDQAIADAGLKEISDLTYLIGTGYGRNKYRRQMKIFPRSAVMQWVCM